jgi:hypothetical protein
VEGQAVAEPEVKPCVGYVSSVYYATIAIDADLAQAWRKLLDYQSWNPTFAGANVTPVGGDFQSEGEQVLIRKLLSDAKGDRLPDFYAETVKIVPQKHVVWCVYPKEGDGFRNFVDFGLSDVSPGVRFDIYYYEQNHLSGEDLAKHRVESQEGFDKLALAFKQYCEARE